jgi:cell division protease FtsH
MGRDIASDRDFSDDTAATIDEEVRQLVDQAYQRAKEVLLNNRIILDKLAEMLVEKETVDSDELQEILTSNEVRMAALA